MDRYVLVAHLKPGTRERAHELLAEHPMHEGVWANFEREAVFLTETEVVFFVEGPDADKSIKAIFDDPSVTEIGHWLPLFDGPLHRPPEEYYWERGED